MDMSDGHGDFRMMNRKVVSAILEMREYNRYMKGLFSFVGFETEWIEYENAERAAGNSKWNFKSLFAYAFEGILSFSTAPLKFAGVIGALLFLSGIGFLTVQLCSLLPQLFLYFSSLFFTSAALSLPQHESAGFLPRRKNMTQIDPPVPAFLQVWKIGIADGNIAVQVLSACSLPFTKLPCGKLLRYRGACRAVCKTNDSHLFC